MQRLHLRRGFIHFVICVGMGLALSQFALAQEASESQAKPDEGPALTIGSKAPAIDVETWIHHGSDNQFGEVTEFEEGKIYVIEFWATWCGPCIGSMPHLAELQRAHEKDGVQIISISDEALPTIEAFLKREYTPRDEEDGDEEDGDEEDGDEEDGDEEDGDEEDGDEEDGDEEDGDEEDGDEEDGDEEDGDEEDGDEEDGDEEDGDEEEASTYSTLTSAYCLTTDPDESVKNDYMRAAAQRGIPCAFVVGKTGIIEWVGHPIRMDEPLQEIIDDSWDREAFATLFARKQKFDMMLGTLSALARKGQFEEAIDTLNKAKVGADDRQARMVDIYLMQLNSMHAKKLAADGEVDQALELVDGLMAAVEDGNAAKLSSLQTLKFGILLEDRQDDATVSLLKSMTKEGNAKVLNQVAWTVYEESMKSDDVSSKVIVAARKASQAAVKQQPENSPILDTLAHFLHKKGDLRRAIRVQRRAVKSLERDSKEIRDYLDVLLKEAADKPEEVSEKVDAKQES